MMELFGARLNVRSWFVDGLGFSRGLFWLEAEFKLGLEPQNSRFLFEYMDFIGLSCFPL